MKNFPRAVRSAFALCFTFALLAACGPNANGMGTIDYGTVTGRVVDRDSLQPIAGATITIGNIVAVTANVDKGGFVLRNVPIGTRTLSIFATGWKSYTVDVTVAKDQTADIGTIGLPSSLSR